MPLMTNAPSSVAIPQNPRQRKAWALYQLTLKNLTLADVARMEGVRRQAASSVFHTPSAALERRMADVLGVPIQQLWADRYEADGTRLYRERPDARRIKQAAFQRNDKGTEAV